MKQPSCELSNTADVSDVMTRKEPQCVYRLLNILFLDAFAEGLAQLGNVAACTELDLGKAGSNQLFWEGIHEAFAGQDEAHDNLLDEVLFKIVN